MRYYEYEQDSHDFAIIEVSHLPDGGDVAKIHWQDCPRTPSWTSLAVTHVFNVEQGRRKELGDFPGLMNFCTIPVFRRGRGRFFLATSTAAGKPCRSSIHRCRSST